MSGCSQIDFDNSSAVGSAVELGREEIIESDVEVLFCPEEDCYGLFYDSVSEAQFEVKCAFYEFDSLNLSDLLVLKSNEGVEVSLIIDGKYEDEEGLKPVLGSGIGLVSDGKRSRYMHNKFCVIDDRVLITGSMNPTENGFLYNDNNVVKIESELLSKNYENEFNQLYGSVFGTSKVSSLEFNEVSLGL